MRIRAFGQDWPLRNINRLAAERWLFNAKLAKSQIKAIARADVAPIELITGALAVAFGMQLLRNPYEFSAAYYGYLVNVVPAKVWAFTMAFAGFDQWFAMLTATRWCRRLLSGLLTCVWTFIAAVCWLSAPNNVAPGTYTVVAFMCAWVFIRLGK